MHNDGSITTPVGLLPDSQHTNKAPPQMTLPDSSASNSLDSGGSDNRMSSNISCSPSLATFTQTCQRPTPQRPRPAPTSCWNSEQFSEYTLAIRPWRACCPRKQSSLQICTNNPRDILPQSLEVSRGLARARLHRILHPSGRRATMTHPWTRLMRE